MIATLHAIHAFFFQIKHGAVPHQSKEHMIVSGRCNKPLGKRTYKKLRKCGARQGEKLSDFMDSLTLDSDKMENIDLGDEEDIFDADKSNNIGTKSIDLVEDDKGDQHGKIQDSSQSKTLSLGMSQQSVSILSNNVFNSLDDFR